MSIFLKNTFSSPFGFWAVGRYLTYILQNIDRYRGPLEIVFQRFSIKLHDAYDITLKS